MLELVLCDRQQRVQLAHALLHAFHAEPGPLSNVAHGAAHFLDVRTHGARDGIYVVGNPVGASHERRQLPAQPIEQRTRLVRRRRKLNAAGTKIATRTITAIATTTFAMAVIVPRGPVEKATCFVTIVSGSAFAPAACTSHAATAIGSRKLNTMTIARMPNVVSASRTLSGSCRYASSSGASPTTRSIGSVNTMPAPGTAKLPQTS